MPDRGGVLSSLSYPTLWSSSRSSLVHRGSELRTCTSGIAMEQLYASQSQPVCKTSLCVARDRVKVQSRRKYVFTDQIDRLIRETYHNRREAKTRFDIRPLAKKVGMPPWALKKRARELGLARTKELPWSEAELGILARYAWMSDERMRLKLKAAGYSRTATGIHLKLKRMRFKHDGRSEEHTAELQSLRHLVCRLLLEKKK